MSNGNHWKDSNAQRKNYSVIVSKQKGDVTYVLFSQEIFHTIFFNDAIVLFARFLFLKTT